MAKISTSQLFDEFFAEKDDSYQKRCRAQVDRPEVYAYEEKISKQLVDMNVDELFDMIATFNDEGFSISYSSYDFLSVMYRQIFEYYIDHYELIRNPWNTKQMRGMAAFERLARYKDAIKWEMVESAIAEIYQTTNEDRAKYIELIIRLFYDGFEKAEEIVLLKEDMIDFDTGIVDLSGRKVQLDPKCMELLIYNHNLKYMSAWRGESEMVSWHDGYFKFPVRPKEASTFDQRPMNIVANLINRAIHERIRNGLKFDINYKMLFYLGFYDWLVQQYGSETTNRIITSMRVHDDVALLMGAARKYGITNLTITQIKKNLRPYIQR